MRDWSDEPWVKLYQRDEADWLAMPLEAQAVLTLTLRKFDRAGFLRLGRQGLTSLPAQLGHAHRADFILEGARYLIEVDGCWRMLPDGRTLFWPNYLQAQTAKSSDRARQQLKRERDRDVATSQGVSSQASGLEASYSRKPEAAQPDRHAGAVTRDVTPAVTLAVTRDVTLDPSRYLSRLDEIRLDESRLEEKMIFAGEQPPATKTGPSKPIDDLTLELLPVPSEKPDAAPKKNRKPGKPRGEVTPEKKLYARMTKYRLSKLAEQDPDGPPPLPDATWNATEINKKLKPLLEVRDDVLGEALGLYFESDFALKLDPPCPLRLFVSQWSQWVSKAAKETAHG